MITLYQFESCPFCSKVRALLHYIDQPFTIVEVSPFGMKELDFTDHKKVPVLKDNNEIITESANIIEYINENYAQFTSNTYSDEWAHWIDDTLVHYLPPLIHPNFKTSYINFKTIIKKGQFNWIKTKIIRFLGAVAMPKVARKMKTKYSIENTQNEFLSAIEHWTENGLQGKQFFGGDKPDFIDCSVFGVLNSCHNLGPVDEAMTHNEAFKEWYYNCISNIIK